MIEQCDNTSMKETVSDNTLKEETCVLEYLNMLISLSDCNNRTRYLENVDLQYSYKNIEYRMQIHCNPINVFIHSNSVFFFSECMHVSLLPLKPAS